LKKILVSLALLVFLAGSVLAIAGFPDFKDVSVGTNIERLDDAPGMAALSWGVSNNGGKEVSTTLYYGFSKWNIETNKWEVVESHSFPIKFPGSPGGVGGVGFGTERELEPGYYMSWSKARAFGDVIRANNKDTEFVWVYESGEIQKVQEDIQYEQF